MLVTGILGQPPPVRIIKDLSFKLSAIFTKYESQTDPRSLKIITWWRQLKEFDNKPFTPDLRTQLYGRIKNLEEILTDAQPETSPFEKDLQDWIKLVPPEESSTSITETSPSITSLECVTQLKAKTQALKANHKQAKELLAMLKLLRKDIENDTRTRAKQTKADFETQKKETKKDFDDIKNTHKEDEKELNKVKEDQKNDIDGQEKRISELTDSNSKDREKLETLKTEQAQYDKRIEELNQRLPSWEYENVACALL